ncbi:MAG: hypothetical protein HY831_00790 [Candidatus Aenigmarchaeota archaeon]|nr:hypothetical protein [Candidatus Aenigmarchaeota archaeon]
MALETVQMINVPRIQAYPLGSVEGLRTSRQYDFEGSVAREMPQDSLGKEYKNIHSQSIVLADQAVLWNTYLLSKLGKVSLPEDFGAALETMFEKIGSGNITNDACDYDNGKKGLKKTKETDRSVRWIKQPERFELDNGVWKAIGGKEKYILVPESGYVESTCDGSYNSETGTPFSTVDTRAKAEKTWTSKGFDPEFARLAVSYFFSREEKQGTSAVGRWYGSGVSGPFGVGASDDPGDGDDSIGALPSGRLSSGARPVSEKTYLDGLAEGKNQAFSEVQAFLQKVKE